MRCVDDPSDIDLILIVAANWDYAAELPLYVYNLVTKVRVRRRFKFNLFTVAAGSETAQAWLHYFQQMNPKWPKQLQLPLAKSKGVLKVEL